MIRCFRPRRLTITEAAVEKVMPMVPPAPMVHSPQTLFAWDALRLVQMCCAESNGQHLCIHCGLLSADPTEPTNHSADCPCRAVLEDVRGFVTREEGVMLYESRSALLCKSARRVEDVLLAPLPAVSPLHAKDRTMTALRPVPADRIDNLNSATDGWYVPVHPCSERGGNKWASFRCRQRKRGVKFHSSAITRDLSPVRWLIRQ